MFLLTLKFPTSFVVWIWIGVSLVRGMFGAVSHLPSTRTSSNPSHPSHRLGATSCSKPPTRGVETPSYSTPKDAKD